MQDYIFRLLGQIRERPAEFLGRKSLLDLVNFSYGYFHCLHDVFMIKVPFLPGFNEFVLEHYHLSESTHKFFWSDAILFFSHTDENAYDEFYKLIDEFSAQSRLLESPRQPRADVTEFSHRIDDYEVRNKHETVFCMLDQIRDRPGAFFGRKSLTQLVVAVRGHIYCLYDLKNIKAEFLPGFQQYVEEYYAFTEDQYGYHGWAEIILFFQHNDDDAFDKFYKLLDEFLEKQR